MSSEGRTYIKRRRLRMFRQQKGKCYYCGCQMSLELEIPKFKQPPLNQCTIEHLFDRFDPMRGKRSGMVNWVAACWKCNNERSQKRQAEFIEEQRRKSGRLPSQNKGVVRLSGERAQSPTPAPVQTTPP